MSEVIKQAQTYIKNGWAPVPIRYKEKKPQLKDWPKLRISNSELHQYFEEKGNIGLLLGKPSGNLVDVDADVPEARAVLPTFLPLTEMIHGRKSSPRSHWWYVTDSAPGSKKFTDIDGTSLIELRSTGGQTVVPPSVHPSGEVLVWERELAPARVSQTILQRAVAKAASCALIARHWPEQGTRQDASLALAGFLIRADWDEDEAVEFVSCAARNAKDEEWRDRENSVRSTIKRLKEQLPATGAPRLVVFFGEEVVTRLKDWLEIGQKEFNVQKSLKEPPWPSAPKDEAYQGLAGEFVRKIEPHTEADPVALLVQILVAFGNAVDRGPYFTVEADRHGTNIFSVIVGATSKARKGSSWSHIRNIFHFVDSGWVENCVQSGLSSGEGLIWAVRDPVPKTGSGKRSVEDTGVKDKRLLILEQEFASPLQIMHREGNTLSTTIRQAWDRGDLRILTKNSPAKATDAHISIIGHITRDELRRHLETTEMANGFANRILWICVKRSKFLPEGGRFHKEDVAPFGRRLSKAIKFAREVGTLRRDDKAKDLWRQIYPKLSEGRPGLFGAITSRSEAQVLRLACLYALLDSSKEIRRTHLVAALALWEYAEASAAYIFGRSLGDPIADEILRVLTATPEGLTRTQIRDHFGRNRGRDQIGRALKLLEEHKYIRCVRIESGGRPTELWLLDTMYTL